VERYPDIGRRYIPPPRELAMMGLPATFGKEPEPYSEHEQDRFLKTLQDDETFRRAVRILLEGFA
jgi:hypothetical protein